MTVRQRVLDALAHRTPDKVPYDIRFTAPAREAMAAYYGDPEFEAGLGNCLTIARACRREEVRPNVWQDEFGVQWDRTIDRDIGVVVNRLVARETLDDFVFPDPDDPALYGDIEAKVAQPSDTLLIVKLSYNLFERAWSLVGMENLLMQMITHKTFVHALFDQITDYFLRVIDRSLEYNIDGIYFGDDWGTQTGLLMGTGLWHEFIFPRIRKMYARVKERDKFVFLHCCGKIEELFPALIECGLDVFNPLQPEVMDVARIKRLYGQRLSFYGGIGTQKTLPFGTVGETKEEVERLMDVVGSGGGYIASPSHAIPADAKPENVAAMIETLQDQ